MMDSSKSKSDSSDLWLIEWNATSEPSEFGFSSIYVTRAKLTLCAHLWCGNCKIWQQDKVRKKKLGHFPQRQRIAAVVSLLHHASSSLWKKQKTMSSPLDCAPVLSLLKNLCLSVTYSKSFSHENTALHSFQLQTTFDEGGGILADYPRGPIFHSAGGGENCSLLEKK